MGSTSKLVISYLIVALVFGLALGIRIFRLGESPSSVNWDEAALGYNAFSLLHSGRDEYAKPLPVSLRSFDDYKPAIYAYLVVPSLIKLPLSDVTTRLPSAIMGSLLTFSVFLITYLLSKSRVLGILAAILIAFEPWALHFSRVAFEANVANSLIFLALALFLYAVHTKKFLVHSLVLFILASYAYHSERIIAIPLLVILLVIYRQEILPVVKRRWQVLVAIFIMLLAPLGLSFITEPVTSRFSSTSLFKLWPFVPKGYSWLVFNPIYTLLWHICGQFLAYFSPFNIFVRGSSEPGQYVPTLGLLHAIEFPLWAAGLLSLLSSQRVRKFLLPIMLLAVLPALITWNWFSVVRTLTLYPAFSILVALGAFWLWKKLVNKYLRAVVVAGFVGIWLVSGLYLITTETIYAPAITYGEYQPGFETSVPALLDLAQSYDKVVIDSPHIAPYIFLLFYGQYDPHLYQSQRPARLKNSGTESLPFGKFEFREINWINDQHLPHTLFVGPTVRLPDYEFEHAETAKIIDDVYDVMGYISLRIVATY